MILLLLFCCNLVTNKWKFDSALLTLKRKCKPIIREGTVHHTHEARGREVATSIYRILSLAITGGDSKMGNAIREHVEMYSNPDSYCFFLPGNIK